VLAVQAQTTTVERTIARLASRAHGVVTRRALIGAGLTKAEIEHRLRTGAFIREHRGVFRVGHCAPSVEARYLAAVLACGVGAVLSGLAAAYLYGIVDGSPPPAEVTARGKRRVRGVITRETKGLDARDVTTWRGIPITTPARTLADVAGRLSTYDLARACHEAGVRFRTTPRHVNEVIDRRPTTPGRRKLRRIANGDEPIALSRLEQRFHRLLRENDLPLPETNKRIGTYRVDCRWRNPPLTVELDSYRFHNSRHAWEQERRREREARARGDDYRRYTYADVFEEPQPMLAELREVFAKVS